MASLIIFTSLSPSSSSSSTTTVLVPLYRRRPRWQGSSNIWTAPTSQHCAPYRAWTATPSTACPGTSSTRWTTRSSRTTGSRARRRAPCPPPPRPPSVLARRRRAATPPAGPGRRGRRGTTPATARKARCPCAGQPPRTCCAAGGRSSASGASGTAATARPAPPTPPTSSPATATSTRSRTRRWGSRRCTGPRRPSMCGIRPSRSPTDSASRSSGCSPAPSTAPTSTASRPDGSQVSPELYGDSRPRLFTYWTSDAYEATGCYNALCPGFVQTSSRVAIGAAISPVSSLAGEQYDMTLLIWKDPKLGNWWLSYGDAGASQLVGYWPAELFTHLSGHASMVEWGGEVVNTSPGGAHTATQMGSGRFASEGFGRASYFRNLETVDAGNSLAPVSLDAVQTLAEDGGCYDIRKAYDERDGWGTHFYYGGPGHNPACP
ncbi:mucin-5AC-like isoform X2 [Hordeum vulgare subsp. vulgare]|uniref:mucin-5AC-like isoform X2 n=1 Tax=Hordeum vulgare subsp. vulgare TaxID=112509 RepID=UPI001D1A4BD7|nr:mucin-5AC-like isoform X2 [Hordeum vulgare subsp. vulgare]